MIAMLQVATPSVSFLTYWPQILATLGVFSAIIAFVAMAVFDAQFIGAFDRCKDRIMARIDLWYKDRIDANARAVALTSQHDDQMTAIEASLIEQGKVIRGQLESHFSQNTLALQGVTLALQAVQKEAQSTAESVARIEGYMDASGEWDGTNRRKRTRRSSGGAQ